MEKKRKVGAAAWLVLVGAVAHAAACTLPESGEGEGGPPKGGDDCAEFCEGPDRDPAMCKTCQQVPEEGRNPEPLPWVGDR